MNATRMDAARSMMADLRAGRFSALPMTDLAMLAVGVLYLISPIDFLPEVALGPLGLLDDTGVFALIMAKVFMMLDRRATDLAADPGSAHWTPPQAGNPTYVPGEVIR